LHKIINTHRKYVSINGTSCRAKTYTKGKKHAFYVVLVGKDIEQRENILLCFGQASAFVGK